MKTLIAEKIFKQSFQLFYYVLVKICLPLKIFTKKNTIYRVETDVDELPGDYYDVTLVAAQQPGLVATRRAAEQYDQNVAVLLLGNHLKSLDRIASLVHFHGRIVRSHFVHFLFFFFVTRVVVASSEKVLWQVDNGVVTK